MKPIQNLLGALYRVTNSTIWDNSVKRQLRGLAIIMFWLAVWQGIYQLVGHDILVASPVQVGSRLVELVASRSFWGIVGRSCLRILAGFVLAGIAGSILAGAAYCLPLLGKLLSPMVTVIKATPVASFILLAFIWFTTNKLPVFTTFLMVFPLMYGNLYQGLHKVEPQFLEMAKLFRVSFLKRVLYLYIPSLRPYFLAACSTGLGFAWKAGIAAEILARPKNSIGSQIYNAKIYMETVDLFAWTLIVIFLSLLIERGILFLLRMGLRERREAMNHER